MSRLDDIQNSLYSNTSGPNSTMHDTRMEGIEVQITPPEVYDEPHPVEPVYRKPKVGAVKTFLYIALVFFFVSVGYFVYVFGRGAGSVSEENVVVGVSGSSFVTSGAEASYLVSIENKNISPIHNVVVLMNVPGASGQILETKKMNVGTVESRTIKKVDIPVTLYGSQYDDRELEATAEFSFPGSRALLKRSQVFPVRISDSPIKLTTTVPESVAVGQEVVLAMEIQTESDITDVGIKVEYPDGFIVTDSTPRPAAGNYFWEFAKLRANKTTNIVVRGMFKGLPVATGSANGFRVSVGALSRDERILSNIYATKALSTVVSDAAIETVLLVNGASADILAAFPGADVSGSIALRNTSSEVIRNVAVDLALTGGYVDWSRTRANNSLINSSQATISWNAASGITDFSALSPGQQVILPFTLATKTIWKGLVPTMMSVSLRGQRISGETLSITNADSATLAETASLGLDQKTLFSSDYFEEIGVYPPVAEKQTGYAIVWRLPRQVVSYSGVKVSATLPAYVEWGNKVFPDNSPISYNSATRVVTWDQDQVVSTAARDPEVVFQVLATPTLVQQNSTPSIIENVVLSGVNTLTGESFQTKKLNHTTKTRGDTENTGAGAVQSN